MSEARIDSPKKQTLYMLGAVAAATVVLWGAARFACNAHPPESRKARSAPISVVARQPKGAAIELQQRWATYDCPAALEFAKGEVQQQLYKDQQECEADFSACESRRAKLVGKVTSLGEVLSRDARSAKVRVQTTADGETKTYLLELTQDGMLWKVVKRAQETG